MTNVVGWLVHHTHTHTLTCDYYDYIIIICICRVHNLVAWPNHIIIIIINIICAGVITNHTHTYYISFYDEGRESELVWKSKKIHEKKQHIDEIGQWGSHSNVRVRRLPDLMALAKRQLLCRLLQCTTVIVSLSSCYYHHFYYDSTVCYLRS